MISPTRRGLLGGSAALAAAPVAAQATPLPHPDADLLALAERFVAHERLVQAMPCDAETDAEEAAQEAEHHRLLDHKHALVMQMGELRATTAEGIAARARCLAVHNADGAHSMDAPDTTTGRLLRWLMRDVAAVGGVVQPVAAVSPDADLLAACAAFDELERAYIATYAGCPETGPEWDAAETVRERLSDAQDPLVDRICDLRAVTREGQAARARSLALWAPDVVKEGGADPIARLTTAIVRDLIR